MLSRIEVERLLHCSKVDGLAEELKRLAEVKASYFIAKYSLEGYTMSFDIVYNRICNAVLEKTNNSAVLSVDILLTEAEVRNMFIDWEVIEKLICLAKEDILHYFEYIVPFFSMKIRSFVYHNAFYVASLDNCEVNTILFTEVYKALVSCSEKGVMINFNTLELYFKAAILELAGTEMPFTLSRKSSEEFLRFRAIVTSSALSRSDLPEVARKMNISVKKAKAFWDFLEMDTISTAQMLENENVEIVYGGRMECGYENAEINQFIDDALDTPMEKNIAHFLLQKNGNPITKEDLKMLGVSRYRIDLVRKKLCRMYSNLTPIE